MSIFDLFKSDGEKNLEEQKKLMVTAFQREKEQKFKEAAELYAKAIGYDWNNYLTWNGYAWNKYLADQVDFSVLEAASIACFLSKFVDQDIFDTKASILARLGFMNESLSAWRRAYNIMNSKGIKDENIDRRLYNTLSTVFISYEFNQTGQDLTNGIIENNNNLEKKFEIKTAKEFSMSSVNEKVQAILKQSFFLVAIITKREKRENGMFGVSNWIIAEIATAISQNKAVVLMVEEGIDINELSCIKMNMEYIPFTLTSFAQASAKVIRVLKEKREQLLSLTMS